MLKETAARAELAEQFIVYRNFIERFWVIGSGEDGLPRLIDEHHGIDA